MIKFLKALVQENRWRQRQILAHSRENEWAHVYHDSIRGIGYLHALPLNVGRWAGSYSFFYLLQRILREFKPKSVLEFGLGESSKMISASLDNELLSSSHVIVEHDENWIEFFETRFELSNRSRVLRLPLATSVINNFECTVYDGLRESIDGIFDLYVIDGPFGSKRFSRYDLVSMAKRLGPSDDFIILFDDVNRAGEQDTVNEIIRVLESNKVVFHYAKYEGAKSQMVFASEKNKFATTL